MRSVGGGGNGLGSASLVDLGHARKTRGEQCRSVDISIGSRRRQDRYILHAGHFCRQRRHQRDTRKRTLAARHVTGDGRDRAGPVAGESAGANLVNPHLGRHLVVVKAGDGACSKLHGFAELGGDGFLSGGEIGFGCREIALAQPGSVQLAGETDQRLVTLLLHIVDDLLRFGKDVRQVRLGARQQAAACRL